MPNCPVADLLPHFSHEQITADDSKKDWEGKLPERWLYEYESIYCICNCCMQHVSEPIATPQPTEKYRVYVVPSMAPTGGMKLLSNEMTLTEVSSQFWRSNKPLELFYEQQ